MGFITPFLAFAEPLFEAVLEKRPEAIAFSSPTPRLGSFAVRLLVSG